MMNKRTHTRRILAAVGGIAALALIFAGCATAVNFQVQRPPALPTLGIQRLAVMPFSTTTNSSLERQAAVWLTNEALSRIQATDHFTLISAEEIERVRSSGGNIETRADALFTGKVLSADIKDTSTPNSYKDKNGNTVTYYTYRRDVQISFNYGLTKTRDGTIVGPINKSRSSYDSKENQSELKTAESMIQTLIQRELAGLGRDVAPYMATERRSLMKESSRDKAVKQQVKSANAMVKAGNYRGAQDLFLGIYRDTGSFASAYNAALLIEVQGDLEGASSFLQRVYNDTGNSKATVEIARLQKAMVDAGLFEAYKENQSQRDRVIALMVETLPARLPKGASVALVSNSRNERELAGMIVSGIIDGFISKGITVVDRNSRALAEMERNYQLSGNVSDAEMVSIGKEAGVNTFVMVSVTGSGASRRLSVRLLDVERGTIIYQSPQTDEMNL